MARFAHGSEGKFSPGGKLVVGNHSSRLTFYTITKQEIRMSSTCSVPPRDLVSVEVAAQQVGAHPQTLLTRSTFPVRYPVRAPERGPRWQTHAQRRNLGISVRPGHPAPAATLPAIPAAAPSGAQDYRWFVRNPLGLTPPGYELAPHTGLDKAPPRTRDEGRLDARATSHWSRIATQPRFCLPGAVTSA